MSVHAAITDLLRQSSNSVGVSSLSSVIEALNDNHVLTALIGPAQRTTLSALLQRIVVMANDGTRNVASRIMNLEILYLLSRATDDSFRQGALFAAVQQLDGSFDAMVTAPQRVADGGGYAHWSSGDAGADMSVSGDEVMEAPRRMLVVILLRCTGYTRLTAGDLLSQVCGGSEERLLALCSSILQHGEYEIDIVLAVVRFLYEMTTPMSYFDAETVEEDRRVDAFVEKMHGLLDILTNSPMIGELLNELAARYSTHDGGGGCAGDVLLTSAAGSGDNGEKLWCELMRYLAMFLQNLVEFSSKYAKVFEFQRHLYARGDNFLTTVAIPFIKTTLQSWEHLIAQTGTPDMSLPHAHNRETSSSSSLTLLSSALTTMRLIRFVLYKHEHEPPSTSLQRGLVALTQFMSREESLLRNEYVGLLILVTLLDCLCNINAANLVAPVDVAAALGAFLDVVANDTSPMPNDVSCTMAEGLALCYMNVDSIFRASTNETTMEVNRRLRVEDLQYRADAEVISIMEQFEQQLTVLQSVIAQIGFGDLLRELNLNNDYEWNCNLANQRRRSSLEAQARDGCTAPAPEKSSHQKKLSKHENKNMVSSRNKRHPAKYCCQLTGHLMREPVTLRNGNHYEYDALMDVINKIGHVDPLTNESIDETVEVNELLQEELTRYRVKMMSRKR